MMVLSLILVTFGLLFFGSLADVPVMFLAVKGVLPLPFILIVGFLADIIPDFFWRWLGGKIGLERFENIPFLKFDKKRIKASDQAFHSYGGLILFCSKFIYLFGIPTQIVAGAHHYPLRKFFVANALGSAGWLLLLYTLAHLFTSSDIAEDYLRNGQLAFTLFLVVAFILYFILNLAFKKFFTGSKE
jgi:membrane protein DedA with SNARE-associated domain